jgi:hypothetical protein
MKGSTKVRMGVATVGLGVLAIAALPASASSGAATISGSGGISPGLTTTGGPQTFSFSGSGTAATDTYQGAFSCTVNGNDTIGTVQQGSGGFTGSCTAGATTEPVSGTYVRVGAAVNLSGSIGPGPVSGTFTGACTFEAGGLPPVVAFQVQCHVAVHN